MEKKKSRDGMEKRNGMGYDVMVISTAWDKIEGPNAPDGLSNKYTKAMI